MKSLRDKIEDKLLEQLVDSMLYGYSPHGDKTVVVMMLPYTREFASYDEKEYHKMMLELRDELNARVAEFA